MSNFTVKLNSAGIKALLQSDELKTECEKIANECVGGASGYNIDSQVGRYRTRTRITTANPSTYRDNLKNNTLLKMIGKN